MYFLLIQSKESKNFNIHDMKIDSSWHGELYTLYIYINIFSIQYFNILMVVSSIMSSVHFHFATVEQQSWDVSIVAMILVSGDHHCYTAPLHCGKICNTTHIWHHKIYEKISIYKNTDIGYPASRYFWWQNASFYSQN